MFRNITGSANLPQELVEAQDLSGEDPGTDEDAGHQTQEAPEVLGSDLTQVHGHHTEGYAWAGTWGEGMVRVSSTQQTGAEYAYGVAVGFVNGNIVPCVFVCTVCLCVCVGRGGSCVLPECIPVMKRPMMTISGEPHILLKPMSDPAINTSTVEFTTVPFLITHTHAHTHTHTHTHTPAHTYWCYVVHLS